MSHGQCSWFTSELGQQGAIKDQINIIVYLNRPIAVVSLRHGHTLLYVTPSGELPPRRRKGVPDHIRIHGIRGSEQRPPLYQRLDSHGYVRLLCRRPLHQS